MRNQQPRQFTRNEKSNYTLYIYKSTPRAVSPEQWFAEQCMFTYVFRIREPCSRQLVGTGSTPQAEGRTFFFQAETSIFKRVLCKWVFHHSRYLTSCVISKQLKILTVLNTLENLLMAPAKVYQFLGNCRTNEMKPVTNIDLVNFPLNSWFRTLFKNSHKSKLHNHI